MIFFRPAMVFWTLAVNSACKATPSLIPCARINEFMRAHGIKDGVALQALFTARVQKTIAGRKKIMVGWDEVLQPDTPKDVVIQSWRGSKSLAEAARKGNRAVLSSGYYIDLNQSAAEHYQVDPLGDVA